MLGYSVPVLDRLVAERRRQQASPHAADAAAVSPHAVAAAAPVSYAAAEEASAGASAAAPPREACSSAAAATSSYLSEAAAAKAARGAGNDNVLEELLSAVAGVVRAAHIFPRGSEYSLRVGGSATAARGVHEAAAETLDELRCVASLAAALSTGDAADHLVSVLQQQARLHRQLAAPNPRASPSSSSSSNRSSSSPPGSSGAVKRMEESSAGGGEEEEADDGAAHTAEGDCEVASSAFSKPKKGFQSLLSPVEAFLDDVLDGVEASLAQHAAQPVVWTAPAKTAAAARAATHPIGTAVGQGGEQQATEAAGCGAAAAAHPTASYAAVVKRALAAAAASGRPVAAAPAAGCEVAARMRNSSRSALQGEETHFRQRWPTAAARERKQREQLAAATAGLPQAQWLHLVDNFSCRFVPRLLEKVHAKTPLHVDIQRAQQQYFRRVESRRAPHDTMQTDTAAAAVDATDAVFPAAGTAAETSPAADGLYDPTAAAQSPTHTGDVTTASVAAAGAPEDKGGGGGSSAAASIAARSQCEGWKLPAALEQHLHGRGALRFTAAAGEEGVAGTAAAGGAAAETSDKAVVSAAPGGVFLQPLPHPYEEELESLRWVEPGGSAPPGVFGGPALLQDDAVRRWKELADTPLVHVTNETQLKEMLDELTNDAHRKRWRGASRALRISIIHLCDARGSTIGEHTIVGLDLEHHSVHSYKGFTCLVQLSTWEKDYIVDPFPLFEQLHQLNRVTANPAILKVLHGSRSDVIWLQRDFSVYVVNMFDTQLAAAALLEPGGLSLRNLLWVYARCETDKQHQRADWRIRPLPAAMVQYARVDTHYLPYLFQRLRNKLLRHHADSPQDAAQAVLDVMNKSRQICLSLYVEQPFDAHAETEKLLRRSGGKRVPLSSEKMYLLTELLQWRDRTARLFDKSRAFVVPPAVLLLLAKHPVSSTFLSSARTFNFPFARDFLRVAQESLARLEAAKRNADLLPWDGGAAAAAEGGAARGQSDTPARVIQAQRMTPCLSREGEERRAVTERKPTAAEAMAAETGCSSVCERETHKRGERNKGEEDQKPGVDSDDEEAEAEVEKEDGKYATEDEEEEDEILLTPNAGVLAQAAAAAAAAAGAEPPAQHTAEHGTKRGKRVHRGGEGGEEEGEDAEGGEGEKSPAANRFRRDGDAARAAAAAEDPTEGAAAARRCADSCRRFTVRQQHGRNAESAGEPSAAHSREVVENADPPQSLLFSGETATKVVFGAAAEKLSNCGEGKRKRKLPVVQVPVFSSIKQVAAATLPGLVVEKVDDSTAPLFFFGDGEASGAGGFFPPKAGNDYKRKDGSEEAQQLSGAAAGRRHAEGFTPFSAHVADKEDKGGAAVRALLQRHVPPTPAAAADAAASVGPAAAVAPDDSHLSTPHAEGTNVQTCGLPSASASPHSSSAALVNCGMMRSSPFVSLEETGNAVETVRAAGEAAAGGAGDGGRWRRVACMKKEENLGEKDMLAAANKTNALSSSHVFEEECIVTAARISNEGRGEGGREGKEEEEEERGERGEKDGCAEDDFLSAVQKSAQERGCENTSVPSPSELLLFFPSLPPPPPLDDIAFLRSWREEQQGYVPPAADAAETPASQGEPAAVRTKFEESAPAAPEKATEEVFIVAKQKWASMKKRRRKGKNCFLEHDGQQRRQQQQQLL